MKEADQIDVYKKPSVQHKQKGVPAAKRSITEVIAEAWEIPADGVLGNVQKRPYVNARKFYFYIMLEVRKDYTWNDLTKITGRKMAAMIYDVKMARIHLALEKSYQIRAQKVLDQINENKVVFP